MAFGLIDRAKEGGFSWVHLPLVAFFHNLTNTDKEVAKVKELSQALQTKHRGLAVSKEATVSNLDSVLCFVYCPLTLCCPVRMPISASEAR